MHMKHVRVAFCPRRQIHRLIYIRSDRITPLSASRDALCQHFQTNEQIWHYRCWFSTNPALRVLRNFLIHSVLIFYVIAGARARYRDIAHLVFLGGVSRCKFTDFFDSRRSFEFPDAATYSHRHVTASRAETIIRVVLLAGNRQRNRKCNKNEDEIEML